MASQTRYAGTITQSGNVLFSDLKNLKNSNNSYATSGLLGGTNNPQPARIVCSNFGFNIPTSAKITSIKIEYAHKKVSVTKTVGDTIYSGDPSINAPNIYLTHSLGQAVYNPLRGATPTTVLKEKKVSWNGKFTLKTSTPISVSTKSLTSATTTYKLPKASTINNSNFGVYFQYSVNKKVYFGKLLLKYIKITVNFTPAKFNLIAEDHTSQEDHIPGKICTITLDLINKARTGYSPQVKITLPENCVFEESMGLFGKLSKKGDNVYLWNTGIGDSSTASLTLKVYFTSSGDFNLNFVYPSAGSTGELEDNSTNLEVHINPTPVNNIEEEQIEQTIYAKQNNNFEVNLQISPALLTQISNVKVVSDQNIRFNNSNVGSTSVVIPSIDFNADGSYVLPCNTSYTGIVHLFVSFDNTINVNDPSFIVKVIPENFTHPIASILSFSDEELDRLADGYTYTVESFLKVICDLENVDLFSDYYTNFRLGIFNQIIPEGTQNVTEYILDHTTKWSSALTVLNAWEEKTVDFTYSEGNPLYVIVTGDFDNNHPEELSIAFSDIAIIENYEGYESPGNFLKPIRDLVHDGSSTINIDNFQFGNSVTLFNFDFADNFGTSDDFAVRGIECRLRVETDNSCVVLAKLSDGHGKTGERSVLVNPGDENYISLGETFDLWGFTITEMINLENWELELQLQNVFASEDGNVEITISDVQLIVHGLPVRKSVFNMIVEGENMRNYGMFIRDIKLRPGIKYDAKYFEVDGSDINSPSRMNIDMKEAEIEFRIIGCNLQETTALLREIAKILNNDRDELNQPIPKRVEFSHIPDFYYNYVLEDPIDDDIKTTNYSLKIKLTIYEGTSWATEDTITNTSGSNSGITKVNPVIQIIPLTETVEITENIHDQHFSMTNDDFKNTNVIEIDCADQKVYFKETEDSEVEDITNLVDWDVDWFILYPGEFSFDGNNTCIIQNVIYTERGA